MWRYVLKRCLVAIVLVWAVATIVFSVIHLIPGDPAELLSSMGGILPPPETLKALREKMGLNQPLLDQYFSYLTGLLKGDLGNSLLDNVNIAGEIGTRLPRTLELILVSTVLSIIIGIPLGTFAAVKRGRILDHLLAWLAGLQLSVPVFVTGTLLVLIFAQTLRWVPAGGHIAFFEDPLKHLIYLSMPVFTITLGLSAVIFRMVRTSVIETMDCEWVRTARAKGLTNKTVLLKHVVRNSMGPVLTVIGLNVGSLLGGTVLVEYVFNWPGLSGFLVDAVEQRDYPAVQSIVLVISFLFIMINLAVDLLYSFLDPRIQYK